MPADKPAPRQVCFVDMPFGKKTDPKSGLEIDFDQIYTMGIEPAVARAGLECIRGDREATGGIIHTAMFARLLLSEFVVADMTSANPNIFYELGIRHAAKPYTTIPLFATLGAPPFDVNMVRAIPYDLENGKLTEQAAMRLAEAIVGRIRTSLQSPVAEDSPLFQLFDGFPGIEMSHELTDAFRDHLAYSEAFKSQLAVARQLKPTTAAIAALNDIRASLGDIATAENGVVLDLLLSYRDVEAWSEMVSLFEGASGAFRDAPISRQQLALALNRRKNPGDRDRAIRVLNDLQKAFGDDAETLGILGRIYKDRYREAVAASDRKANGWLDLAIETYTRGFEAKPLDFYPGVNALNLLLQTDAPEAGAEIARLAPLVTYAAVRRGGEKSNDYWTVATLLELACIMRDYALAQRCLERALVLEAAPWMFKTTRDNLVLIARRRIGDPGLATLDALIGELSKVAEEPAKGTT